MDQLLLCKCRHSIENHGADGCDVNRCPCPKTAQSVLELAVSSAKTQYGQWSEPA